MEKLIYKVAMYKSKKYLINKYSLDWYQKFHKESRKYLYEVLPKVPDIGKSIFSFNYKFAPSYIAWYLTLEKMGISNDEKNTIHKKNEEHNVIPTDAQIYVGNSEQHVCLGKMTGSVRLTNTSK